MCNFGLGISKKTEETNIYYSHSLSFIRSKVWLKGKIMYRNFYRYLLRRAEEEVPEDEILQRSYQLVVEAVFHQVRSARGGDPTEVISACCGGCLSSGKKCQGIDPTEVISASCGGCLSSGKKCRRMRSYRGHISLLWRLSFVW
jgi:hypothetical protein